MPAIEATEDGPYLGDDRLEQIHVRLEVTRAEKRAAHAQVHRLRSGIGAMVALLGGLDGLVFTGGVGEGSARIRELACAGLAHLGVAGPDVEVLAIHAREDLDIARQVRAAMSRAT